MTLELKPELEALIQKQLQSGAFSSPEEVIERALEFLSAEEDWLSDNREMIATQIQEGWEEAQRGELTDEESVRAEMRQYKEDWKRRPAGMSRFALTRKAKADLRSIWSYIALDNIETAGRWRKPSMMPVHFWPSLR